MLSVLVDLLLTLDQLYYVKFPKDIASRYCLLLDPMLGKTSLTDLNILLQVLLLRR